MRSRSDVLAGLVVGGFLAMAYLVAGPLTLISGVVVRERGCLSGLFAYGAMPAGPASGE
jgi:hypothetical protein